MKKTYKTNKTGFTMIEMMLVIAVIVILAGVLLLNISQMLSDTETKSGNIETHNGYVVTAVTVVNDLMADCPTTPPSI